MTLQNLLKQGIASEEGEEVDTKVILIIWNFSIFFCRLLARVIYQEECFGVIYYTDLKRGKVFIMRLAIFVSNVSHGRACSNLVA